MSIFSCVMAEVQDIVTQVTQQANLVDEVVGGIRSGMGPITGGGWTGQSAASAGPAIVHSEIALVASSSFFITELSVRMRTAPYMANHACRNRVLLFWAPNVVPSNLLYQVYCSAIRTLAHGQPGA